MKEEIAFVVVVVILSIDLQTGLVVEEEVTVDVVAELNSTKILDLFVSRILVQSSQHVH